MSTLAEIEAAVDRLPEPEQEILLGHLTRKLGARRPVTERGAQHERWLQKLDRLQNRRVYRQDEGATPGDPRRHPQ
jgi:hypothetical protein